MQHRFLIGYRRQTDGSAIPVCDPPVDQFLLDLWQQACTAILATDAYLVTAVVGGSMTFDGRMRPDGLVRAIGQMAAAGRNTMEMVERAIREGYPFGPTAEYVVGRARAQLLMNLGRDFVVTEAPAFEEDGRIMVERARVEFEDGQFRVVVTGNAENHPLRAWADGLIRDGAQEAILERLLRDGGSADA